MAQKFPFSMWNYNPPSDFTPDEVNLWADCGMTHPMLPRVTNVDDLPTLIPFLDRAEELGLKCIINCKELSLIRLEELDESSLNMLGPEGYEELFRRAVELVGNHPATYGFYIGDEPLGQKFMHGVTESYRIMKKVAPHLHPFVNYRDGTPYFDKESFDGMTFEEWVDHIGNDIGVSFITLDEYGPMINDNLIPSYLKSMRDYVAASEKAGGKPDVWANLLSSAHYAYHVTSEIDLRWQVHTAVACGCRGVMWFRFYDRLEGHEYYASPIDEYGNKTDTYYGMLRTQRRFNDQYGEIIMKLKRKSTFHVGKDYDVYPVFDNNSHEFISLKTFEDTLISFFEDDEGREYFCLVTLVKNYHSSYNLFYDEDKCSVTELIMNGKKEIHLPPSDPNAKWSDFTLYPGQMRLFRIDKK